jgi:plastocyanin
MERLARGLVVLLVLSAVSIPVGGVWLGHTGAVTEIRARMAEDAGWTTAILEVQPGEPLELRLTSDDVVHGFAVGRHDSPEVDVLPGVWTTTSLIFDSAGTYTFYCTRWCGPNHWRMRGTIEVADQPTGVPSSPTAPLSERERVTGPVGAAQPRYIQHGIDLDAPQRAEVVPEEAPSAQRGERWALLLPAYALEEMTYWRHSPAELWARLRTEPALQILSDMDIWDTVAWIWAQQTTPEALAEAARIYNQEAAAAHGEAGRGDGVIVRDLPPYDHYFQHNGHGALRPPDFTDPHHTLGASPARLEGKMLRGGMGTGMPSYGEIYTGAQIEALVSFIYTFVMDLGAGAPATE